MNCFKHSSTASVGVCKSCSKGLCIECAAELENGLACKNRCESQVEFLNLMVSNHRQIMGRANKQLKASGIVSFLMGVAFLFLAAFGPSKSGASPFHVFFLALGIIFVVYGAYNLRKKSTFPVAKEETRT